MEFLPSEGVDYGGVLYLLPSLIETGLLSYREHYEDLNGYYDLDATILSLAFLYLCRIKTPEQTKQISPGEFGKLLGYDRIPEAKNLRKKISQIANQKKSMQWNTAMAKKWVYEEANAFYYIDGHVQVYSGSKAILIAVKMFSRWTQENFFKYLRSDYALDHIVHYLVTKINDDFEVVNPPHRKLTNTLKKLREKITRENYKKRVWFI